MKNTLVKSSIFNMLYNLLNAIFPLISVTYASNILMNTGIGKVDSAQNIAQYFVILAPLGITNYGIREIAKVKNSREQKNIVFSELFLLNFFSTICFACLYYILIFSRPEFAQERELYIVTGLAIICNFMNVDWYYKGMEEFQYIATRNFVVKCITLCLLLLGVKKKNDYVVYALIGIFATMGNYFFNVANLRKHGAVLKIRNLTLTKHIRPMFVFSATSFAIELYALLDVTMISYFCQPENVAYYNNAIKLVRALIVVIAASGGALLPRLSMYREKGEYGKCGEVANKVFEVMYVMLMPCGIGLFLISEDLILLLFGNSFVPCIVTMKIASLLIYSLGFSNLFGTQILLTFGGELKTLLCTIVGAASNICMNLALIPRYQQNGAAAASVVSEGLVTLTAIAFSRKYIRLAPDKKIIFIVVIAVALMAIAIVTVNQYLGGGLERLLIDIVVGGSVYIGVNVMLGNPIIRRRRLQI